MVLSRVALSGVCEFWYFVHWRIVICTILYSHCDLIVIVDAYSLSIIVIRLSWPRGCTCTKWHAIAIVHFLTFTTKRIAFLYHTYMGYGELIKKNHADSYCQLFQWAPFMTKKIINGQVTYVGMCYDMLKELAVKMNFR